MARPVRRPPAAAPPVDDDQLWIMVDVETSGPVIGRHSLTEIGAAVGSARRGLIDRFEALLKPISAEVQTSRDSFARAARAGLDPTDALRRFATWCRPHQQQRARFVARPAAFDWPWIVWYAWTFLNENPFGFKAVCASSWFEARGARFDVELPHVAVRDAEIQLRRFLGLSDALLVGGVGVSCLTFSRDGQRVAAGSPADRVQIWDVATREPALTFAGHSRSVYCVAFSPDGTCVASGDGEDDEKPGRIAIWDSRTAEVRAWLGPYPWSVAGVAWSPDGARLASACYDGSLRVHDARSFESRHEIAARQGELNAVAWSADGRWIATGGGAARESRPVKVWDATSLKPVRELKGHRGDVSHVAFGPDGALATLSADNVVNIWDVGTGRLRHSIASPVALCGLAFDGLHVACGAGKQVRIWNAGDSSACTVRDGPCGRVTCVALSPDGRTLAVGAGRCAGDGEIRLLTI